MTRAAMPGIRSPARIAMLRSALLFSPFFAITVVILVRIGSDVADEGPSGGRIAVVVLVGAVALLLGYMSLQSMRDVFSRLVETTGLVERRWSRNEYLLFRNTYIFVEKNVYRLSPEQAIEVDLGDVVRIVHSPHMGAVESIDVVERASERRRPVDA